jgi:hypothetical protein
MIFPCLSEELTRSVFKEVEKLLLEKGYSKEQVKKILRAISTLKLKGMVCYYMITEMLKFKARTWLYFIFKEPSLKNGGWENEESKP